MIAFGIYEQVINDIISRHLQRLGSEFAKVQTAKIDPAESSKILADYLAGLIREVFDRIEGEADVLEKRVELCNRLIEYIGTVIEKGELGFRPSREMADLVRTHIVNQDAKMLLAIADKKKALPALKADASPIIRPDR